MSNNIADPDKYKQRLAKAEAYLNIATTSLGKVLHELSSFDFSDFSTEKDLISEFLVSADRVIERKILQAINRERK